VNGIRIFRLIFNSALLGLGLFFLSRFPHTGDTVAIAFSGAIALDAFGNLLKLLTKDWLDKQVERIVRS